MVKRVADGLTHKRTDWCTNIRFPRVHCYGRPWEADAEYDYEEKAGEQHGVGEHPMVLHPDKYNISKCSMLGALIHVSLRVVLRVVAPGQRKPRLRPPLVELEDAVRRRVP